jgi:hypothetical protein
VRDEPDLPVGERPILERVRRLVTPALVAEHREHPFGPHSPALVQVLQFLRRNVALDRPRYVTLRDGEPPVWRLGAVTGRGDTFAVVDETPFPSREEAEHAVFLRRLADYGLA